MNLRHGLAKAASGTVLVKAAYIGLTLAGSIVLARALGPDGYGIYALVFSVITILGVPAQAGVPVLLLRETAKASALQRWGVLKGIWRWSTGFILISSLLVFAAATASLAAIGSRLDPVLLATSYAGLLLLPFLALGDTRAAALRGLRYIIRGQIPESIMRPGLLLLFASATWALTGELTAPAAMGWHVLAAAIAFIVGGVFLWRLRPPELKGVPTDLELAASWRRAVLPLALINGAHLVSAQIGILLLGYFRPDSDVGLYKVASSAAALAVLGLQMASVVIQPHIARLHVIGDVPNLQRLSSLAAAASTGLTIPVFLLFLFAGDILLQIFYGAPYREAWIPLVILGAGRVVCAIFGTVTLLLSMTGHEVDSFRWLAVAVIFNALLALVLIPIMGMSGAAIAHASSLLLWNFAFRQVALRKVGVDGSIFALLSRSKLCSQ